MPGPVHSSRRRRLERWIRHSFLVRFHMGLILAAVVLSGLGISWLLLAVGLTSMAARFALAVLLGYGVFFGCVRLWLLYVEQTSPPAAAGDLVEFAADVVLDGGADAARVAGEAAGTLAQEGSALSDGASGGLSLDIGDGEGIVVLLVLGVVLAVFFGVGFYLVYQAPVILSEAAGHLLLAAALRRRAKALDAPDWSGSVLRATWIPALIVLLIAVLAGLILQSACPEANRVAEAIDRCVLAE